MTQNINIDNPNVFKVSGKDVFLSIISRPETGWPLWTCVILSVVALIVGCFADDMKSVVISLILLFAITPSVGVFMYYYHLLASDMVTNILPHSLERNSDGFILTLYKREEDSEENEDAPVVWSECDRIVIPDTSVIKVRRYIDYNLLYLTDAPLKALYVPTHLFLKLDYENTKKQ